MGETLELSQFLAHFDLANVPEGVVHEAKRALVDWFAVAFAGADHRATNALCRVSTEYCAKSDATLVGRAERASIPFAALINGFSAHVLDYDDTYNPGQTTIHGSAPVWPVVCALSEDHTISGRAALAAFIAGFETEARIARAAGPRHYEVGWHVSGTTGHFGAAAAAAVLRNLSVQEIAYALGAAGTQAAGLKEVYGTDGKPFHVGKAAMDGLLSVLFVEQGFTSATTILEGQRGFLQVFSPEPQLSALLEGLGETWHLPNNGYKAYPAGSLTHPTIDALLELRRAHQIIPDNIAGIEIWVHPYAATTTGKTNPTTGLAAKFSISHCAAIAIAHGRPGIQHFQDDAVGEPMVSKLRNLVTVHSDDALTKQAARVCVRLANGAELVENVENNLGTPKNPLSDKDLEVKFLESAAPRLGAERAHALVAACWSCDQLDDFGALVGEAA